MVSATAYSSTAAGNARTSARALASLLRAADFTEADFPISAEEWDAWEQSVIGHGVAALMLEAAKRLRLELPEDVARRLRIEVSHATAAILHSDHELARVLAPFEERRIPVMLLKGAALHRLIYENPAHRPMGDMDLLLRPCDLDAGRKLLASLGYEPGRALVRPDFFPTYHYEMDWSITIPRPVRIDLHARPLRPMRIAQFMNDDALWDGASAIRVGSSTAFVPRPALMLIHLCAHAAYHGFGRLIWLYDIHEYCRREGKAIDWDELLSRCRAWRLSLPVKRALARTGEFFGPVAPRDAMQELDRQPVSWRDRLALHHAPHDGARPVRHVLVNLLTTPGMRFKFGYARAVLAPQSAHLGELYPYRHRGWRACAHAWRSLRAVGRAVLPLRRRPTT